MCVCRAFLVALVSLIMQIVTISNYVGKDRDYIKKLLLAMGAEHTPTMTGRNTAVVAA